MDFPGWGELRGAVLSASLGAFLALGAASLAKLMWRRLRRQRRQGTPGGTSGEDFTAVSADISALRAEAQHMEEGLRALSKEVEDLLDSKLDRLERHLKDAKALLGDAPAKAEVLQPRRPRWDPLATVDSADRNRVVELAALGELPEAIADSVGLLRGEVDLILRLHKSTGKPDGRG